MKTNHMSLGSFSFCLKTTATTTNLDITSGAYPGGGGEALESRLLPPLKYKLIYICSQRNSGNRTSEDALTFSFLVFT